MKIPQILARIVKFSLSIAARTYVTSGNGDKKSRGRLKPGGLNEKSKSYARVARHRHSFKPYFSNRAENASEARPQARRSGRATQAGIRFWVAELQPAFQTKVATV
jgi:hypothetical protein